MSLTRSGESAIAVLAASRRVARPGAYPLFTSSWYAVDAFWVSGCELSLSTGYFWARADNWTSTMFCRPVVCCRASYSRAEIRRWCSINASRSPPWARDQSSSSVGIPTFCWAGTGRCWTVWACIACWYAIRFNISVMRSSIFPIRRPNSPADTYLSGCPGACSGVTVPATCSEVTVSAICSGSWPAPTSLATLGLLSKLTSALTTALMGRWGSFTTDGLLVAQRRLSGDIELGRLPHARRGLLGGLEGLVSTRPNHRHLPVIPLTLDDGVG